MPAPLGRDGVRHWAALPTRSRTQASAQPGSRGPEAGGPAEEAGSEQKEARCSSGPAGSIAAGGLGSADACACCRPGALSLGSGIPRDQLSLAVALVSIDSRVTAKVECKPAPLRDELEVMGLAARDLNRLERYERRALSGRKRATETFMAINHFRNPGGLRLRELPSVAVTPGVYKGRRTTKFQFLAKRTQIVRDKGHSDVWDLARGLGRADRRALVAWI